MFFRAFSWLRAALLPVLVFLQIVHARENSLFTSSVTYCEPPEAILIQNFDVAYIAKNASVFFNITAASVQPNLNVSANLLLNVYGMNPVNITLDLCNILGGILCPLPQYTFNGSQSIPLPSDIDVSSRLPQIAFKIPDLEGFAQLILTESTTGNVKACVQATLSNGWSMHQLAAEWTSGALAIFALLLTLWQSRSLYSTLPFRFLDLMQMYQTIAVSGFLSLNYPSAYRAFTLNFAWALGLFSSPDSGEQRSIDRMRALTGGNLANSSSGSAIELVNRKLSPYNVKSSANLASVHGSSYASLSNLAFAGPFGLQDSGSSNITASSSSVQTVTNGSDNVLEAGLPIYVNSINIGTANAFMTTFFTLLILLAVLIGIVGILYGVLMALSRRGQFRHDQVRRAQSELIIFVRSWMTRLCLICVMPLTVLALYQWTLRDSWLTILLSVIVFLAIWSSLAYYFYIVVRYARRLSPAKLLTDAQYLAAYGPIFGNYKASRYYFSAFQVGAVFLKGIFISAAKGHGDVQVALFLVVEVALFVVQVGLRPMTSKWSNVFSSFLSGIRVLATALLIAFVQRVGVEAIPRTAIGIVIAVILSVTVVVIFFNLLFNIVLIARSPRIGVERRSDASSMEKGMNTPNSFDTDTSRPINPTPEHNVVLDPSINKPYPTSPTATNVQSSVRDSASTTLGSLMPRRWSFSQPHSAQSSPQSNSHQSRDTDNHS